MLSVPVALIMRVDPPYIKVFRSGESEKNPYKVGDKEHLAGSGLYCETVIKTKDKLLIPNALKDKLWNKNPDVKLGLISYLGFPILYPNGDVFGTLCILDVKENKYDYNTENLMIQFKEIIESHLSLLYLNKNLKFSEEKFRNAYEQVNFYKDLFSHDISNIIQVIYGSIQNYFYSKEKQSRVPDKAKDLMERIQKSIYQAMRLVSNVRKITELEQIDISLKKIEAFKVLNKVIENIKKTHKEKKININIQPTKSEFLVLANEFLENAFENILNNAIKYNDSQIVEILIKGSNESKDNQEFLKLEFLDNGIGISDEKKAIIFQKGKKEHIASKGMGLGLSLVNIIVNKYNGKIWVEDRVKGDYKQGSNFVVLIPKA